MSSAAEIKLPMSRIPVFPARCVNCGGSEPTRPVRLTTQVGGRTRYSSLAIWNRFAVTVPVCEACRLRFRIRRGLRSAFGIGNLLFAGGLSFFLVEDFPNRFVRKLLGLGLALVLAAPYFVWSELYPPEFDFDASSLDDSVTYRFHDSEYAAQFDSLNPCDSST